MEQAMQQKRRRRAFTAAYKASFQNCCRCSRRTAGGRPGDRSAARPARSERLFRLLTATLPIELLRRPIESAQYTSIAFGQHLREAGLLASMGSRGDAYDNALCESFFASLEYELLDRSSFVDRSAARVGVFDYIECWYNPHRRHSALDMLSPLEFERHWRQAQLLK